MLRSRLLVAAAILTFTFSSSPSEATPMFGSASYTTARSCSAVTAIDPCDGSGPGQHIFTSAIDGGAGLTSHAHLTLGDGSFADGSVSFGALDLPVVRGSSHAVGDVRMNSNNLGYQSYVYTGAAPSPLAFTGLLNVVDSSTDGGDGTLPNGAIYSTYVAIWDPTVVGTITDPFTLFTSLYSADCTTPGVLAFAYATGPLPGGPQSLSLTTASCGASPYIINPGDEVLAVAGFQVPVNRGGFIDASHTFIMELDPTLPQAVRDNLTQNLLSGKQSIPEPASLMLLSAGLLGFGFMTRRRRR